MRKPAAIHWVATFLWLAAGIAFAVGVSLQFPGTVLDRMWRLNPPAYATFHPAARLAGGALFALSLAVGATAGGFSRCRPWAWWAAAAIFATSAAGDLCSLAAGGGLFRTISGAAISTAFLLLLFRRDVRDSIGSERR